MKDLTGVQSGKLTVLAKCPTLADNGDVQWVCKCDCGNVVNIRHRSLVRSIPVRSCGCLQREAASLVGKANATHGLSNTPTWHSWWNMCQRCNNPNNQSYSDYGGRGITVCPRWESSYEHFLEHMGEKPSSEYTIERMDNDKGYYPGNCIWATRATQNANKRGISWFIINGEKKYLTQLAKEHGIKPDTLWNRVNRLNMSIEDALAKR